MTEELKQMLERWNALMAAMKEEARLQKLFP